VRHLIPGNPSGRFSRVVWTTRRNRWFPNRGGTRVIRSFTAVEHSAHEKKKKKRPGRQVFTMLRPAAYQPTPPDQNPPTGTIAPLGGHVVCLEAPAELPGDWAGPVYAQLAREMTRSSESTRSYFHDSDDAIRRPGWTSTLILLGPGQDESDLPPAQRSVMGEDHWIPHWRLTHPPDRPPRGTRRAPAPFGLSFSPLLRVFHPGARRGRSVHPHDLGSVPLRTSSSVLPHSRRRIAGRKQHAPASRVAFHLPRRNPPNGHGSEPCCRRAPGASLGPGHFARGIYTRACSRSSREPRTDWFRGPLGPDCQSPARAAYGAQSPTALSLLRPAGAWRTLHPRRLPNLVGPADQPPHHSGPAGSRLLGVGVGHIHRQRPGHSGPPRTSYWPAPPPPRHAALDSGRYSEPDIDGDRSDVIRPGAEPVRSDRILPTRPCATRRDAASDSGRTLVGSQHPGCGHRTTRRPRRPCAASRRGWVLTSPRPRIVSDTASNVQQGRPTNRTDSTWCSYDRRASG
jgi:hypothetical protein